MKMYTSPWRAIAVASALAGALWITDAAPPLPAGTGPSTAVAAPLVAPLAFVAAASVASVAAVALQPAEAEIFGLVNQARAAQGLAALVLDADLIDAARSRASDQVPLPTLSHVDSSGQVVMRRLFAQANVRFLLAGENLARVVGVNAASRAHVALMESPGHRANILEPRYTALAVGVATDAQGRSIFTELFRQQPA